MDSREPFAGDPTVAERDRKASEVPLDDRRVHDPPRPGRVSGMNDTRRQGEDDRDRRNASCVGPFDEGPPGVMLDIRGVDDDEPSRGQPPNNLAMEDREGRPRSSLIGLITAEECPVRVGRQHLVRAEVAGGECRLAGSGGTDEDDERRIRDPEGAGRSDARKP